MIDIQQLVNDKLQQLHDDQVIENAITAGIEKVLLKSVDGALTGWTFQRTISGKIAKEVDESIFRGLWREPGIQIRSSWKNWTLSLIRSQKWRSEKKADRRANRSAAGAAEQSESDRDRADSADWRVFHGPR